MRDRPIGMLMPELNRFVCNACCLRCVSDGTKSFSACFWHARFVIEPACPDHLRVGRERVERWQDCRYFWRDPLGQGDVVLDGFPGEFRHVSWYQDVGILLSP